MPAPCCLSWNVFFIYQDKCLGPWWYVLCTELAEIYELLILSAIKMKMMKHSLRNIFQNVIKLTTSNMF